MRYLRSSIVRLVLPALSGLQLVQATVCTTDCPDRETFPAVTFTSLAATLNVNVFAITSAAGSHFQTSPIFSCLCFSCFRSFGWCFRGTFWAMDSHHNPLQSPPHLEVRFIVDAGVDALINVTSDSNYDAGAASCPFFRMVAGNVRPSYEHSSHGWSFGN